MKRSNLSKLVGSTLLTLSLATLPTVLPASAQTTTTPTPSRNADTTIDSTRDTSVDYRTNNEDRDFDWGWLGLLGLAGLAGLVRPKREEPVRYREPDEVSSRPGTRY